MHPLEFMERAKDKNFRAQLKEEPHKTLQSLNMDVGDSQIKFVSNTADTIHIPIPPDPNENIQDEDLGEVSGGFFGKMKIKASSLGTALSTASSADIFNTQGKNEVKIKARMTDSDTGKTYEQTTWEKTPKMF